MRLGSLAHFALAHIMPRPHVDGFRDLSMLFRDKYGIEIGGLSNVFSRIGPFPIYPIAYAVDNCNVLPTKYRMFYRIKGDNWIQDGVTIKPSGHLDFLINSYDFLISSHTFEHIANPLKALLRWKAIVDIEGVIFLVVPHKNYTLDHNRSLTTMDHLIEDYNNDILESDTTHFVEIAYLTDTSGKVGNATGKAVSKAITKGLRDNGKRILHHHTFIPSLMEEIFEWADLRTIYLKFVEPEHIAIAGVKK